MATVLFRSITHAKFFAVLIRHMLINKITNKNFYYALLSYFEIPLYRARFEREI